MLDIQKYIKKFKSVEEANIFLRNEFKLTIKKEILVITSQEIYPVWVYNYNMIESPKKYSICNDARALILDEDAEIVSMSFRRFYNFGEYYATNIDWQSAIAETKEDGSLIIIYDYKGKFFIQTRSMATANGYINNCRNMSYRTAIESILGNKLYYGNKTFSIFGKPIGRYCYVFEFVSPNNRHITPYEKSELKLLTIVDKIKMEELSQDEINIFAEISFFNRPNQYIVDGPTDVERLVKGLKVTDEGFVIIDKYNNRIKFKNKAYLSLYNMVSNSITTKLLANIVSTGDKDEVLAYFPEYYNILNIFYNTLKELVSELNTLWLSFNHIKAQKQFAEQVKHHPLSDFLFKRRSKKIFDFINIEKKIKPRILISEVKNRCGQELDDEFKKLFKKNIGRNK